MHIHILGICGTFMGGIAVLAKQAGHKVTGCDANVYPPMSTQLEAQGIELIEGFSPEQTKLNPDIYVIGNGGSAANASHFAQDLAKGIFFDAPVAKTLKAISLTDNIAHITAIANDTTAPAGVTFSAPGSFAAGLLLGDMAPGAYYGVWERRNVNAGAASANDSYTLRAQGDTNP